MASANFNSFKLLGGREAYSLKLRQRSAARWMCHVSKNKPPRHLSIVKCFWDYFALFISIEELINLLNSILSPVVANLTSSALADIHELGCRVDCQFRTIRNAQLGADMNMLRQLTNPDEFQAMLDILDLYPIAADQMGELYAYTKFTDIQHRDSHRSYMGLKTELTDKIGPSHRWAPSDGIQGEGLIDMTLEAKSNGQLLATARYHMQLCAACIRKVISDEDYNGDLHD